MVYYVISRVYKLPTIQQIKDEWQLVLSYICYAS